eukprot:TRINITY_DN2038_c0_g1_i1.p1 TRINITY_DN2038_c0_g1~~TRINITY_DN2038_c0_g1_i1.p1  ORF type:complete len:375 (+),score=68.90 TRINITY_DN2038_c0_g1_i1:59-1183(+)
MKELFRSKDTKKDNLHDVIGFWLYMNSFFLFSQYSTKSIQLGLIFLTIFYLTKKYISYILLIPIIYFSYGNYYEMLKVIGCVGIVLLTCPNILPLREGLSIFLLIQIMLFPYDIRFCFVFISFCCISLKTPMKMIFFLLIANVIFIPFLPTIYSFSHINLVDLFQIFPYILFLACFLIFPFIISWLPQMVVRKFFHFIFFFIVIILHDKSVELLRFLIFLAFIVMIAVEMFYSMFDFKNSYLIDLRNQMLKFSRKEEKEVLFSHWALLLGASCGFFVDYSSNAFIPLCVLTFGDAAAACIGSIFPIKRFNNSKSVGGVLACVIWMIFACYALEIKNFILISVITGFLEFIIDGIDNLFLPIALLMCSYSDFVPK